MPAPDKPVTVRLPDSDLRKLMGLSIVDGGSLADQLRSAVSGYLDLRLNDPELESMTARARERQDDVLAVLAPKR